jgi:hypothetical protein
MVNQVPVPVTSKNAVPEIGSCSAGYPRSAAPSTPVQLRGVGAMEVHLFVVLSDRSSDWPASSLTCSVAGGTLRGRVLSLSKSQSLPFSPYNTGGN